MGATDSKAVLVSPFTPIAEWKHSRVEKLLDDYKAQDLDFGLDAYGLSLILDGDKSWSEKIITGYGSQNGLINVLSFITGSCLVALGSPEEKARLCFRALDFNGTGRISMDEMTILFLCALRGFVIMSGYGKEPRDEPMEAFTLEAYKMFEKGTHQEISREEFMKWISKRLRLENGREISGKELLAVFGLFNEETKEAGDNLRALEIEAKIQDEKSVESNDQSNKESDDRHPEDKEADVGYPSDEKYVDEDRTNEESHAETLQDSKVVQPEIQADEEKQVDDHTSEEKSSIDEVQKAQVTEEKQADTVIDERHDDHVSEAKQVEEVPSGNPVGSSEVDATMETRSDLVPEEKLQDVPTEEVTTEAHPTEEVAPLLEDKAEIAATVDVPTEEPHTEEVAPNAESNPVEVANEEVRTEELHVEEEAPRAEEKVVEAATEEVRVEDRNVEVVNADEKVIDALPDAPVSQEETHIEEKPSVESTFTEEQAQTQEIVKENTASAEDPSNEMKPVEDASEPIPEAKHEESPIESQSEPVPSQSDITEPAQPTEEHMALDSEQQGAVPSTEVQKEADQGEDNHIEETNSVMGAGAEDVRATESGTENSHEGSHADSAIAEAQLTDTTVELQPNEEQEGAPAATIQTNSLLEEKQEQQGNGERPEESPAEQKNTVEEQVEVPLEEIKSEEKVVAENKDPEPSVDLKEATVSHPSDSKAASAGYPIFTPAHRSLMAKFLTPTLYDKLKDVKTSKGFTLDNAIQPGVDSPHLGVGVVAGDEECYELYRELFDAVIEGWHNFKPSDKHKTDMNASHVVGGDLLDSNYIISTRVRAGRSIRGLSLPPGSSRSDRRIVERLVKKALEGLQGDLQGTYYPLGDMTPEQENELREDHFLFQKPGGGTLLCNAGAARDWPDARGIFHNHNKTFLVWVNEEDHMRIISMQNGGNIAEVFERWTRGIREVQESIKQQGASFMYSERLGYLGTCPSNLGTGLRTSMFVKLALLGSDPHTLDKFCDKLGLQARGSSGEHSAAIGGVYDISNKARIGFSEAELVQTMINGVHKLIELEKLLEGGAAIDVLLTELPEFVPPSIDADEQGHQAFDDNSSPHYEPESDFPKFTPRHKSLMARTLTEELYTKYKDVKTATGYTLAQAIRTGVETPHLGVGITAGDEECYTIFQEIFDPIIEGWHNFKASDVHITDMDVSKLVGVEGLDDRYIISTRVRSGRSIRGLALPPGTSRTDRRAVEKLIREALATLSGELQGEYYPLFGMSREQEDQLREDHFLFQKPGGGTLLTNAGAARDWPDGRGIFHNVDKNFLVWVNEEDHMRVISMQQGGNIKEVFTRWVVAVNAVEESIKKKGYCFMHHERLGFLGTCPSNLGTGLRASMFVSIPLLGADIEALEHICDRFGLQPRGSAGEHSESIGGVYDISNKARLGKSEVELVQTMIDGVSKIIAMEKLMSEGVSRDEALASVLGEQPSQQNNVAEEIPSGGEPSDA